MTFLLSDSVALSLGSITSITCSTTADSVTHDGNNKSNHAYNCSAVINLNAEKTFEVGVYSTNATTTKVSGNASQTITITSPASRFLVNGPAQGGTSQAPITTNSSYANVTMIKTGIRKDSDGIFNFTLYFDTYDADYAENTYRNNFRFILYKSDGTYQDEYPTNPSTSYFDFTVPEKVYLTSANPPVCSIETGDELYSSSHYEASDQDVVFTVKSNNTWQLEAKIDSIPTKTPQGWTIPSTNTYIACNAGANNACPSGDGTYIQFPGHGAGAENYRTFTTDNNQTRGNYRTGTTDNMNLDAVTVTATYFLRGSNSQFYNPGSYTCTTTFNLTAPR